MFSIIGYVIVFGVVIGGFVIEGGPISILNQPVEFLIIGGAGIGALVVGTPLKVLAALGNKLKTAVVGNGSTKSDYMELFAMLYEIFSIMRKSGEMALNRMLTIPRTARSSKSTLSFPPIMPPKTCYWTPCDWSLAARPTRRSCLT